MPRKFRQRLPSERLPLTSVESKIYDLVRESYINDGRSISYQKMGYLTGNISRVAIWYHINALEHKGWISREPKTGHSLIPLVYLEEVLDKEGLPDLSMPDTS